MSFKVLATENFKKEARKLSKRHKSLPSDLLNLIESLEVRPNQGVALRRNCFKLRIAIKSKGKGKSGGARVIIHVKVESENVYLLSIYDKSQKESLKDKELDYLLKLSGL